MSFDENILPFDVLGLKKLTDMELYEQRDCLMRQQYVNSIEYFPQKIDQLLVALNQVCSFFVWGFRLDIFASDLSPSTKR